ncbi:MAG: glycosyltransferase family 4 protein, partial [Actinomycetota bacterium]|nr:glycosyltransferase family 4 protein [Actinomycetota bacterium]
GWRPGGAAGSVAYAPEEVEAAFAPGHPVLLYVGRFTAVKRVGLLIEAHQRAVEHAGIRAPLVLVGGFPGEWEGEHPADAIGRLGARDVFLAGWHGHDALPAFLNAADAIVLPSVREQFGQVLVEAGACGLPAVAVDAHGPAEIVVAGETGWLVGPDDGPALADALGEVIGDAGERARRGDRARARALDRYAWPALAREVAEVYEAARQA